MGYMENSMWSQLEQSEVQTGLRLSNIAGGTHRFRIRNLDSKRSR